MGISSTLPDDIDEVDVIVAGGGTAGCIVASRLAAVSPALQILVIESGADNWQDPAVVYPVLFFGHLMPDSKSMLYYQSKPSSHMAGRAYTIPAGGCLGGGSSVNMMTYSRGQRSDFDDWNMPGWNAESILKTMRKLETFHGRGSKDVHGSDGLISISGGTHRGIRSEDDLIMASKKAGWPEVVDLQDLDTVNAVARAGRYISPEGVRQDTAHRYLHPLLQDGKYENLYIVTESQVQRVLVENGRATGVVYHGNPRFNSSDHTERTVKARKMVVVSCGALGTPLVLERSGVGNPDVLIKANVPTVVPNKNIGINFQDHQLMAYTYRTNLDTENDTINKLLFGKVDPATLIQSKDPILGYNAQDVTGKLRPTDSEVAALGPAFQRAWSSHFAQRPDKPLVGIAAINCIPGLPSPTTPYDAYLGMSVFSMYPLSRGYIHITGPKIADPIDFDTGFLSDSEGIDVKKHIWAYKKQREIMRRMQCYRGELADWHPAFAADSPAAVVVLDEQLPGNITDIAYSAEDDITIEKYVRSKVGTTWHSMGTCRMGKSAEDGVVDARLSVFGVQGLKLADLSICPGNIGANTNNTALVIGEKAAELFIEDLGLNV